MRTLPFDESAGTYMPISFNQRISSSAKSVEKLADLSYFDTRYYRTLPSNRSLRGSASSTVVINTYYE